MMDFWGALADLVRWLYTEAFRHRHHHHHHPRHLAYVTLTVKETHPCN